MIRHFPDEIEETKRRLRKEKIVEKEKDFTITPDFQPVSTIQQEEIVEKVGRITKLERGYIEVKNLVTDLYLAVLGLFAGSAVFTYKNFNESQYWWGLAFLGATVILGRLSRVVGEQQTKDLKDAINKTVFGKK